MKLAHATLALAALVPALHSDPAPLVAPTGKWFVFGIGLAPDEHQADASEHKLTFDVDQAFRDDLAPLATTWIGTWVETPNGVTADVKADMATKLAAAQLAGVTCKVKKARYSNVLAHDQGSYRTISGKFAMKVKLQGSGMKLSLKKSGWFNGVSA